MRVTLRQFSRADEGSMPLAMLLILVSVTLSGLMVPIVLTQLTATSTDARRVRALHAAQAGLDVAMAYIRAAQGTDRSGVLTKLPCGPMEGKVGGGTPRYKVTIAYWTEDPRTTTSGSPLRCYSNGPERTPRFALLTAEGSDAGTGTAGAASHRTLTATYVFNLTNENIPGGLIHLYRSGATPDLCLAAESGQPRVDSKLYLRVCNSADPAQVWIYDGKLRIVLSSTRTTANSYEMCVELEEQTAGKNALARRCVANVIKQQQWSFNDSAYLQGTTDGVNPNGLCLSVRSTNTVANGDVLGFVCNATNVNRTWALEATVGAGAASGATSQLVNFSQFGRCLDVTNQQVASTFLIVWPCKQAPNQNNVTWNQKWTVPVPVKPNPGIGRITTKPGALYCLHSPNSIEPFNYVTVVVCPSGTTDATTWKVYGQADSYAKSYIVTDYWNHCLAPTDPAVDKFSGGQNVSKVVVAKCDGSTSQKWNAPPDVQLLYPLKDIHEK
jgi:hypothetical protein